MTPTQRLVDLFDTSLTVHCDLSIFESDEPDAPAMLQSWAAAHELRVENCRDVMSVKTIRNHRIDVYLRGGV